MIKVRIIETENGLLARSEPFKKNELIFAYDAVSEYLVSRNFQRTTSYRVIEETGNPRIEIECDVIALNDEITYPEINDDGHFENDEEIIGQWEFVGEFVNEEDFANGIYTYKDWYHDYPAVVYFLQNGMKYWHYSWSKGKYIEDGVVNPYKIIEKPSGKYMLIDYKGYQTFYGGQNVLLVLHQVDHKRYRLSDVAVMENVDFYKYEEDEEAIGTWIAYDYCPTQQDFVPGKEADSSLYFKKMVLEKDGKATLYYEDHIYSGDDEVAWTKGEVLRKFNFTACHYMIMEIDDVTYMIIEWKNSDYRFGGYPTDYYVFIKER